jgi:hypothetical protein
MPPFKFNLLKELKIKLIKYKMNKETKFLIPKFFKKFIQTNIYDAKYLKEFVIVSMLRNFLTNNEKPLKKKNLIVNKILITKPIYTNNLTITTNKCVKELDNFYNFPCYIIKIIVHINGKFNPTNIKLFDTENRLHFYQLDCDDTLHVNMGILTLFKILSSENVKTKQSKSDFFTPNSNLSYIISKIITGETIIKYTKNQNDE